MNTYTIDDLRDTLFAAMEKVMDGTLSLDHARTVADLAQVVVNTAKVEVDFCRATEADPDSRFFAPAERTKPSDASYHGALTREAK